MSNALCVCVCVVVEMTAAVYPQAYVQQCNAGARVHIDKEAVTLVHGCPSLTGLVSHCCVKRCVQLW